MATQQADDIWVRIHRDVAPTRIPREAAEEQLALDPKQRNTAWRNAVRLTDAEVKAHLAAHGVTSDENTGGATATNATASKSTAAKSAPAKSGKSGKSGKGAKPVPATPAPATPADVTPAPATGDTPTA